MSETQLSREASLRKKMETARKYRNVGKWLAIFGFVCSSGILLGIMEAVTEVGINGLHTDIWWNIFLPASFLSCLFLGLYIWVIFDRKCSKLQKELEQVPKCSS